MDSIVKHYGCKFASIRYHVLYKPLKIEYSKEDIRAYLQSIISGFISFIREQNRMRGQQLHCKS